MFFRFISYLISLGKAASLFDEKNPDWVPNQKMGYTDNRQQKKSRVRNKKRVLSPAISSETESDDDEEMESESAAHKEPTTPSILWKTKCEELMKENLMLEKKLKETNICLENFRGDNTKTAFFFGLATFTIMDALYSELEPFLPFSRQLTKFQVFFITLNRLRLSTSFTSFAYQFNVTQQTIFKYFHQCMFILHSKLRSLVHWVNREDLQLAMPKSFKRYFGNKVTVIVDCFEIMIETSSQKQAICQTWSNYKHAQTAKFLIGISAFGQIMYISDGYGGRASGKDITMDCGFLSYLEEGDVVLADRDFLIRDDVIETGADRVMPAFIKGKNQLHPLDVESKRKIANLRVHVERVIEQLRIRFKILALRKFPISTLIKTQDESDVSVIDQILVVCCALVNLNPGIVD